MSPRSSFSTAIAVAIALLATGCAQAAGEVCQLDGDCEASAPICCKSAADMLVVNARGVCRTLAQCEMDQLPDAQVVPTDAGVDAPDAPTSSLRGPCERPDGGEPFCFSGLECFRGICLEPDPERDAGPLPVDSGTDSGSDAGSDAGSAGSDAGQDAALDGGP